MSASLTYRPEIDGLRAFAVLSVVFYHLFPDLLKGGLVGVDVFFVISGFLITSILIKKPLSLSVLRDFYIKRINRLFPALLLVLIATFVFGWFSLYPSDFQDLGFHIVSSSVFISNFVFMGEAGYFDRASELKPLLHLWSLAVEEQFYIFWPFLLFFALSTSKARYWVGMLAVISLALCLYLTHIESSAAYFFPLSRFWELLVGALLAIAYYERSFTKTEPYFSPRFFPSHKRFAEFLAISSLFVLTASFFLIKPELGFPGWQAVPAVLATVALIHSTQHSRITNSILSNRVVTYVGKISYPLYLWHWPIISYLVITESHVSSSMRLSALLVSCFLAFLTYEFVEMLGRKGAGKTAVVLTLFMMIVGYIGFNTYSREGLNFRPVNYQAYKTIFLDSFTSDKKALPVPSGADKSEFLQAHPNYQADLFAVANAMKRTLNPAEYFRVTVKGSHNIDEGGFCNDEDCRKGKPLIVVLGDSYAMNVYEALARTHKEHAFVLFADSGCVPIQERYQRLSHRCRIKIEEAVSYLRENRVDALILAARWPLAFEGLQHDLVQYRSLVDKIGLVGPGMVYQKDISNVLLQARDADSLFLETTDLQMKSIFLTNSLMKEFASNQKIGYFDRLTPFCLHEICRLTATGNELIVYDSGHLTTDGALILGSEILKSRWLDDIIKNRRES